jgi:hypothetical protein
LGDRTFARSGGRETRAPSGRVAARLEILAYAPTEFYHCLHCEAVWDQVGLGAPWHAEQRASALPADLAAEYTAISDWVGDAARRYGERLQIRLIDAASLEGVWNALRHRLRRFPAFLIDGRQSVAGFDRAQLEAALARRLSGEIQEEVRTSPEV